MSLILLNDKNEENNINNTPEKENEIQTENEGMIKQLNETILEKDMIIKELSQSSSKIEKEYKLCLKQIMAMKNHISNLEKGLGIEQQITSLQDLLTQKEQQIIILSDQIKEYQSKCDEIIIQNSSYKKDEQIKLLLNEVKSLRNKMQNILSFEGRIDNYEELMEIISKIIKYLEQSENEDLKLLSEKIKFLAENYELNGQKFHNKIMQEIFGINNE